MSNHPQKGSRITVDPIRSLEAIDAIKKLLSDSPRDLLLFTLGINNGLRVGDLLKLRWKQLKSAQESCSFDIKEGKTGKTNCVYVNKAVIPILERYRLTINPRDEDFVFKSRKGDNQPVAVSSVNNLIKKWCKAINLDGNYGSHTLRKTFGYIQRSKYNTDIELIAKRFNHSSPRITMRYVGLTSAEVIDILKNDI
jgi:integrase